MQSLLIVTEVYGFDAGAGCLRARCHDGRLLQVESEPGQTVNCDALASQGCPFFLLCDRPAKPLGDGLSLSPRALISVVPFSAAEVEAMIASGQAEQVLEQVVGR